ncbi:MAG: small subunit ribosomal protein S11 [Verrucomicrobiales bacterium]|jgi:small subunit ribosomal protein S11
MADEADTNPETDEQPVAAADEAVAEASEQPKSTPTDAPAEEAEVPASAEEAAAPEEPEEKREPQTAEEVFLALEGDEDKPKILKTKGSKNVNTGIVHVSATYNNTKVTVSDVSGNVIGWSTSGKLGFRGSRKSTAYAAQLVSQDACRQAMSHGLRTVEVRVKGPGAGRESAVRAVQNLGIDITTIRDVTPVPHNGCRPRKPRRV